MYQGMCRASIEQTERLEIWLDGSSYVSRDIERNLENSIEKVCVKRCQKDIEPAIELVSDKQRHDFSRRKNNMI